MGDELSAAARALGLAEESRALLERVRTSGYR